MELGAAADESRPELTSHLPSPHPGQVDVVGPVGGPRLHLGQVAVEIEQADVVPEQLAQTHREIIVAVDDWELCEDPRHPLPSGLTVFAWQGGCLRSSQQEEEEKRHALLSAEAGWELKATQ